MRLFKLLTWIFFIGTVWAQEACHIPDFPWYHVNPGIKGYVIEGRGKLYLQNHLLSSRSPVTIRGSTFELVVNAFRLHDKTKELTGQEMTLRAQTISIHAQKGRFNLHTRTGKFQTLNFLVKGKKFLGRGGAKELNYRPNLLQIKEGIYTHCPKNAETWFIQSPHLEVDPQSQFVILSHPTIHLLGHTIPAGTGKMRMSVSGERVTGWLPPRLQINSKLGVALGIPYFYRINDWSDVENTMYLYSHPDLAIASKWRVMRGNFFFNATTFWLPFDNASTVSQGGRFGAQVKLRSNPRLPYALEGDWGYVGDKEWTQDFTWVNRINQFFVPRNIKLSGEHENYRWKMALQKYQFISGKNAADLFLYERIPDLSYEQFWDNLFHRSRLHVSAHGQYLKPVGISSRVLPEGGRSFGLFNYEYTVGNALYFHLNSGIKWLIHAPVGKDAKGLALGHFSGVLQHDFRYKDFFLTPQLMVKWVPFHDQSHFPFYDTFSSHNWPFEIGVDFTDPDRIFDHSEIGVGLGYTSGLFRMRVIEQYAVNFHRICIDPGCQIDWLASHHWSPLSIEAVYMGERQSIQLHMGLIFGSPLVDYASISYIHKGPRFDVKLGFDWQRKGYNLNRQEVIDGVSQMFLDLHWDMTDNYDMNFSPFFVNDGRQKLGYQWTLGYHDCCFSSSLKLSLAPRTWDKSMSFSHRPDVSFQISFTPR